MGKITSFIYSGTCRADGTLDNSGTYLLFRLSGQIVPGEGAAFYLESRTIGSIPITVRQELSRAERLEDFAVVVARAEARNAIVYALAIDSEGTAESARYLVPKLRPRVRIPVNNLPIELGTDLDMTGHRITGIIGPYSDNDAATKAYADTLHIQEAAWGENLPAVTVESGSFTTVASLMLEAGHYYDITFFAQFATNDSGRRYICMSAASNANSTETLMDGVNANPTNGTQTRMQLRVQRMGDGREHYFVAYQNSGAALNVQPRMSYIKTKAEVRA